MVASLITTTIIGIMLVVMMKKTCLAAHRASRILVVFLRPRSERYELVMAFTALILLISVLIFAVAIK